jgi:outer membrane autotransporter protein
MAYDVVSVSLGARRKAMLHAGAAVLALSAMLAWVPQTAHAAGGAECGADGAGADALTCTAASYPTGITYTGSDGLTLNLNNPAMTVQQTAGNGAVDLEGSGADLTVNATSLTSIAATGITTSGIYVSQAGAGDAVVMVGGGSITSVGRAVQALNSGTGNASVTMTDGSITTTGNAGVGLTASSVTGDATVTVNGGTISTTSGTAAYGAYALTTGTGTAAAVMSGGTITVSGTTGTGLRAQSANGLSVIRMTGGTVTGGSLVTGILATNNNSGTGTYDISITGGTVNGGNQAAVQGYSTAPGGVITIGKDAIINAKNGATGTAVLISGVNAAGGTVTTAGTINGQIKFTTVTANTLNITGGTIAGNIIGDGADTLNFDLGTGGFNYDPAYSITGFTNLVMKSGTATVASPLTVDSLAITGGTLNLTGATTVTGITTVAGGKLSVNGSLTSAVTIASGGTLGGNGTVGATTIQSGGAIAPGNSIGTLHINGAFAANAGSIYQVEADPTSNASDLILVNGAATIASGATINVTKNPPGNYRLDAQYTVLTASGGVTGNYTAGGDTAVSQFLALRPTTDANNVYLRVVQMGDPASAATTPNQTATATATDSLPATSGVGSAVLNTPDTTTTRAAFDALSGEALASAKGVLISSSVLVRDTTFDRLRDVVCPSGAQDNRRAGCVAAGDKPSLWMQGFGDWGHTFGNANAAGVSQTTGGFLAGVDVPVSDWRLGIFGGYSRSDFNVTTRASAGASDTYHLGAYGGTMLGDINLRLGASYSWSGIDTDRLVAFNTFTNDLRANYNAGTTQVFGEIGHGFQAGRFSLEPFANLAYVGIHTKGFSETGGDAALTSRADTTQDMFATFGVRPSTDITIGSISAVLRGMAGWRHTFGDITPSSLVSFAGSTAFTVTGAPIAKEAGVVEAGVSANLSDAAAIGLTYGGQFSNRETDHGIRGTLAITF